MSTKSTVSMIAVSYKTQSKPIFVADNWRRYIHSREPELKQTKNIIKSWKVTRVEDSRFLWSSDNVLYGSSGKWGKEVESSCINHSQHPTSNTSQHPKLNFYWWLQCCVYVLWSLWALSSGFLPSKHFVPGTTYLLWGQREKKRMPSQCAGIADSQNFRLSTTLL